MAKKIKIFSTQDDPKRLENEINQWLDQNENVNIISLTPCEAGDMQSGFRYSVTIFYNEEPKVERQHKRRTLTGMIDYAVHGKNFRDFIKDVSEGGAFITTGQPFDVGKEIALILVLPTLERPLKINGEIVRISEEGIGVKFKKQSQVQDEMIQSFLDNI